MVKVELDVLKKNKTHLIDFHHKLPVIKGEVSFQFEVGKWQGDVTELTFSDFRANSNHLNPMEVLPVRFENELQGKDGKKSWSIQRNGKWRTPLIRLQDNPDEDDRRLIEYTLTMKFEDGSCVAIDPPLDERRRKR